MADKTLLSKTEATVLRRLNYGNTSRVLVFYTRRYGQVRLIAKGVRRRAKKRAGEVKPELFAEGELVFYPARSDGLGILREWYELDARDQIGRDHRRYLAACYAAEVTEGLSREGDPSARLYALVSETLGALSQADGTDTIISAFELGLLAVLGLSPELARCTICGTGIGTADQARPGPVHYAAADGGAVCSRCVPQSTPPAVELTPGAVAALRHLARIGPASAAGVRLARRDAARLRKALAGSIAVALGRIPRTMKRANALEIARGGR